MRRIFHWRPKHIQFVDALIAVLVTAIVVVVIIGFFRFVIPFPVVLAWLRLENAISQVIPPLRVLAISTILALGVIALLVGGYRHNWNWTGFGFHTRSKTEGEEVHPAKTLWDWMQLLIIPAVLAGGALYFNYWNTTTQNQIAMNNQREAALQTYIDRMSELMLDKGLRISKDDDEIRNVARTRTLTVLRMLDGNRKGLIVQFLWESKLITPTMIVNLEGADLTNVELFGANLPNVNLSRTILMNADLSDAELPNSNLSATDMTNSNLNGANLSSADLTYSVIVDAFWVRTNLRNANLSNAVLNRTDLSYSNLSGANLSGAFFSDANLRGAIVTPEQLATAGFLRGAILPDGSKHD